MAAEHISDTGEYPLERSFESCPYQQGDEKEPDGHNHRKVGHDGPETYHEGIEIEVEEGMGEIGIAAE